MTVSCYEAHRRRWPALRRRVAEAKVFARLWLSRRSEEWDESIAFDASPELEAVPTIAERLRHARRHRRRG